MTSKLALTLSSILICGNIAYAGEVGLLKASSRLSSKYGVEIQPIKFILVTNNLLESERPVVMEHNKIFFAKKIGPTNNSGEELWQVETTYNNNDYQYGEASINPRDLDFQIGIDSGNGIKLNPNQYYLPKSEGTLLGDNIVVSNFNSNSKVSIEGANYPGLVVTKKFSENQKVEIIYSTNNWKTAQWIEAKPLAELYYGYSLVPSPNMFGAEVWSFTIPFDGLNKGDQIEYAIKYTTDDSITWDNNYERNYSVTLY